PGRRVRFAYCDRPSASETLKWDSRAADRMMLLNASATGLRRTLAIPGNVSSKVEICDPPSSDTTMSSFAERPGRRGRPPHTAESSHQGSPLASSSTSYLVKSH